MNEIGLGRREYPRDTVEALREVYRIVFRSKLLRRDALAHARSEFGAVRECARFLDFVETSKRGIARHGRD